MDSSMTVLRLLGVGLSPYAARGISQTLKPVDSASVLRRTVNGALKDVADPIFRKFESTIQGADQEPPSFGGWWPGMEVTVHCAAMLSRLATTEDDPEATDLDTERTPVPGSVQIRDGFLVYRPVLIMRVTDWNMTEAEWERGVQWAINLEEV